MSGRQVGTAQATASSHSSPSWGLAFTMGIILLAAGFLAFSGPGAAAPEDPPSVAVPQDMRTAYGQTLVIQAKNTNNDGSTSWDVGVPAGVTVDNVVTSSDELTVWATLTITSDAPSHFSVTFTATDGQGNTDSASLDLDPRADASEADINALTDEVTEDTDITLQADIDPLRRSVTTVEFVKNYPGGVTNEATNTEGTTYEAGFNYEHPGVHEVGYRTIDSNGFEVVLVEGVDVAEKAPEISTPFDELDTAVGQQLSFVVSANDDDGDAFDLNLSFVGNELSEENTYLNQDGDTARVWTTVTHNEDGVVYLDIEATDSNGASSVERLVFNIGNDPDISTSSPASVVEDTDVILTGSIDAADLDATNMKIWKNFKWDGGLYLDEYQSNAVDEDTWKAVFNYGKPALHHPGYQVELANGGTVTLVGDLDVTEQVPSVVAPGGMRGASGQTIAVIAEATDDESVTWDVSASPSGADSVEATLIDQGDRIIWQWEIGDYHPTSVDVTFTATDPHGVSGEATSTVRVSDDKLVTPLLPEEDSTGFHVRNPITGLDVNLQATIDDVTTLVGVTEDWPANIDDPLAASVNDEGYHEANTVFLEEGRRDIGYILQANNGGLAAVIDWAIPMNNDAPVVEAGVDEIFDGSGEATLVGHASDPENRILTSEGPNSMYEWYLVSAPTLSAGDEVQVGDQHHISYEVDEIGTYVFELRVADPYGAVGTDTKTVVVDDSITASGSLSGADGQTQDGTYVFDPATSTPLSRMHGQTHVVDDLGQGVEDADVTGTVLYYGTTANANPVEVTTFETTTDDQGIATFQYDKDLMSVIDRGESLASAPGYHEIRISVDADSRANAPLDDAETASVTIPYWVGPGGPLLG